MAEKRSNIQVFICYAKEDLDFAQRLYGDLKRAGVKPWMDEHDLLPGEQWEQKIYRAMTSSSFVIALLSSHSLNKRGFVQKELKRALSILDEFPSSNIFLIPARIENCEPQDDSLRKLHWVDLFRDYKNGLHKILQVLIPESPELQEFSFETVFVNIQGKIVTREQHSAQQSVEDLGNEVLLEMVSVRGGTFWMGSPETEQNRYDWEGPLHPVTVSSFFMDKYLVTQEQWTVVMGKNPSTFKGARHPVEEVSWDKAMRFCEVLSEKTGHDYRLPTEAEWEYACRAGTTTPFHFGETITKDLANYGGWETTNVGSFPPNAFGLYDMHGNVWEWCQDWFNKDYYAHSPSENPRGPESGSSRVIRGGSWGTVAGGCLAACRAGHSPGGGDGGVGFRLVRTPS